MISFKREDSKVKVFVEHGIFYGNKEGFSLEIEQGQSYRAELLTRALQANLNRHLEKIKREYYQQCWKDCQKKGIKAIDRKQTNFYGGWE